MRRTCVPALLLLYAIWGPFGTLAFPASKDGCLVLSATPEDY